MKCQLFDLIISKMKTCFFYKMLIQQLYSCPDFKLAVLANLNPAGLQKATKLANNKVK